jgi:hypothetical protein
VNRVNEAFTARFNTGREPHVSHVICDCFEGLNKRCQINLGRCVFIPNNGYSPSLRGLESGKLIAIANSTHIAAIGVEEIDRPVLGFLAVVSVGASDFELDCPFVRD